MAKRKFNKGGEVRLVAYYRYSGGSGQTEQSIEGQRRDCEAYARLHNMTIQKEYVDRHISGKTDDRAAFQQMIADSDKGAFDMVICWKTDRFARNRYDSAVYKKRLRDNGVEIVYAAESNISGAEGIIIEGVMEALAEYYSAELAEKMRRGMRESALKGQAISRCRALGLKTDEHKRFVIDEKTAPTVRFIFEHYAAGESAMSIVEQLNAKGLRTSQGNPFNKSSIPRIIQNEAYRGVYISKSYDVRIEGAIPAIIDDELWERAQTMLKLNRQLKAKNEPKADYILSGKLYCSCGSLMRGMSGHSATGEVYRYYTCPNKDCHLRNIPKDDLEGKVMQSIVDHLLQPESMEALAEAMVEVQKADAEKPNAERVAIEQSLADVRRRSKNILDAIENGTANAQLCARLNDLTEQEQTLSFQLSSLEKEKPVAFTKEQYLFLLEQFLVEPSERTPEYGRRLVNTFVTSMVVSDRELVINFNVSDETVNQNKKASQIKKIKFNVKKKNIARVNKKGVVTALNEGNTKLVCKVTLKNKKTYKLNCKITVKEAESTVSTATPGASAAAGVAGTPAASTAASVKPGSPSMKPNASGTPVHTDAPDVTQKPSAGPDGSITPDNTDAPADTAKPDNTPDTSKAPADTAKPDNTPASTDTPDTPSTVTKTSDSPKTGDNTNIYAYLAMLGLSCVGLGGMLYFKRRRKKS